MEFYIKWIGQSGYVLSLDKQKICIDPYLSCSVERKEGLKRLVPIPIEPANFDVNWIIITHNHLDHLDPDTISCFVLKNIRFACPSSCISVLQKLGIKSKDCICLNRGESINIGSINVYGTFAEHTVDSIGVVVNYDNITVYFTGDTIYNPELLKIRRYKPDILVSCINGRWGNMDAKEAGKLAKELGVKVAIPSHYGMFKENTENPEKLRKELVQSKVKYFELPFNKKVSLKKICKKFNFKLIA